jgi:basic membrane protein A
LGTGDKGVIHQLNECALTVHFFAKPKKESLNQRRRNMKRWAFAALAVLTVLSLVLAGCGGSTGEGLKVGMVSDVGGIDDASFNQNTWEGLQMAQEKLGVQSQFIQSEAQADYEKNITEFAEQDYDLIVTVGFLLGDATSKMAAVYPDIKMAIIDFAYDPPIPNVAGIVFNVDEAAFPIGYLAAGWASLQDPGDPQVGWVGGMQIPPVEQFIVAYEAGVAYYNQ